MQLEGVIVSCLWQTCVYYLGTGTRYLPLSLLVVSINIGGKLNSEVLTKSLSYYEYLRMYRESVGIFSLSLEYRVSQKWYLDLDKNT